jgi:RNA polymerase sigma-70 factor (ECF subfamily)
METTTTLDEQAFRRVVDPYRAELHAHCYRMLGSLHDAEDALQNALLGAWRGLPSFEGRAGVRRWLYKIATNACLDVIARRPKRVLPIDGGAPSRFEDGAGEPLVESVWVEPYPDEKLGLADGYAAPEATYEQREAVELAFIAALQHLPARQRAVLILREVLGFSAREVADSLDTTVPSVNSALQRSRQTLGERLPERSQQATLRSLGEPRVRELVQRYVDAWERHDVDAIVAMLAEDVVISMPPFPSWFRGPEVIVHGASNPECGFSKPRRHIPLRANGQLAVAIYQWDDEQGSLLPVAIEVLALGGDRVIESTGFLDPGLFVHFGLPAELPPPVSSPA